MEVIKKIGKHDLKFICDYDEILKSINSSFNDFEEDCYVEFYNTHDDGYLTKEDYENNIKILTEALDKMNTQQYAEWAIGKATKKKNGTFNRTRVCDTFNCNNCIYFTEWHNSWSFYRLKVKAHDDKTLKVYYEKYTDTPC